MTRFRTSLVLALALLLGMAFATRSDAQPRRRGAGPFQPDVMRMIRRASDLTRLAALEKVQKELSLSEEQVTKLNEIDEKLRAERREQYGRLREIQDEEQRSAKTAEWAEELGGKVRDQLREVLAREQLMRLYQIRLQLRGALEGLTNEYIARRLELSEETKKKLQAVQEELDGKVRKLYQGLGELSSEQRGEKMRELFEKSRKLQAEADEQALGLLTDGQKERFENMKGEKFELDMSELYGRRR